MGAYWVKTAGQIDIMTVRWKDKKGHSASLAVRQFERLPPPQEIARTAPYAMPRANGERVPGSGCCVDRKILFFWPKPDRNLAGVSEGSCNRCKVSITPMKGPIVNDNKMASHSSARQLVSSSARQLVSSSAR